MVGTRSTILESDDVSARYRISGPGYGKESGRCGKDGEEECSESEELVEHAGGLCGSKRVVLGENEGENWLLGAGLKLLNNL